MTFGEFDTASVNADVVVCGIGFGAELADGVAVHRHPAIEHQLLAGAPRRDTGLRQDLLKAFHSQKPATKTRKHEKEHCL